jgi:hypothetical protein
MAFADHKNDDRDPNLVCGKNIDWREWVNCPNLKYDETKGGFDKEVYVCEKCGRYESAYYDDMR